MDEKNFFYIRVAGLADETDIKIYGNNRKGYNVNSGVTYIEVGKIPITIRYADYDKMFKGAITVIVQYAEQPAKITVSTMDDKLSQTLILGGTPNYSDVGVFRLFEA